jgi:hypothetical protein
MRIRNLLVTIISINILLQTISPAQAKAAPGQNPDTLVAQEVQSLYPLSTQIVNRGMEALSNGLEGMRPEERDQFNRIFDPSETGEIDEEFVTTVLDNYRKIKEGLVDGYTVTYTPGSRLCSGMQLYYTDFRNIYVCPYFVEESDPYRKARTLVHEVAHIQLKVWDREYYHPKSYSSKYASLTPRGPWTAQLPVVGPIFREITHSDTLYHPDAYAWFGLVLLQPEKYETPSWLN